MGAVDWTYIGCGICCAASDETTAGALDTTAIGFSRITRRFFNGVVNPFGGGGEDEDEEDECSPTPCPPLGLDDETATEEEVAGQEEEEEEVAFTVPSSGWGEFCMMNSSTFFIMMLPPSPVPDVSSKLVFSCRGCRRWGKEDTASTALFPRSSVGVVAYPESPCSCACPLNHSRLILFFVFALAGYLKSCCSTGNGDSSVWAITGGEGVEDDTSTELGRFSGRPPISNADAFSSGPTAASISMQAELSIGKLPAPMDGGPPAILPAGSPTTFAEVTPISCAAPLLLVADCEKTPPAAPLLSAVPSSERLPPMAAFEVEMLRRLLPGTVTPSFRCSFSSCLRCCDCSIFANAFTIASILRSSRVSFRLGFSVACFFSERECG
uniref:Uncharacterized protein n=1 Tax=Anopheles merus TaxID=30066 RepID=A0A182VNM1_ANOME